MVILVILVVALFIFASVQAIAVMDLKLERDQWRDLFESRKIVVERLRNDLDATLAELEAAKIDAANAWSLNTDLRVRNADLQKQNDNLRRCDLEDVKKCVDYRRRIRALEIENKRLTRKRDENGRFIKQQ